MRLIWLEFFTSLNEELNVLKRVVVQFGAEGVIGGNHSLEAVKVSGKGEVSGFKKFVVIEINTSEVFKDVIGFHPSGNLSI